MAININFSFERVDGGLYTAKVWGDSTQFDFVSVLDLSTNQPANWIVANGQVTESNTTYESAIEAGNTIVPKKYQLTINPAEGFEEEVYIVDLTESNNVVSQSHEVNIAASKFVWSDISTYNQKEGYTLSTQTSGVIKYPISTFKDDIVFSNKAQYNISPIYVGTWQSTLQSIATYVSTVGSIRIVDTVNAAKETTVDASTDLCCFNKAVQVVKDRYDNAKCKNSRLADKYMQDLQEISALYTLIQSSIACNELDNIASYVAEAKKIAEMSSGCGCNTSDGSLIVDIFGNVAYVLDGLEVNVTVSGESPIEVTSENDNHVVSIDIDALNIQLANSGTFDALATSINNVDNNAEVAAILNYLYSATGLPVPESLNVENLSATNIHEAITEIATNIGNLQTDVLQLFQNPDIDIKIPIGYGTGDSFAVSSYYGFDASTYLLNTDYWHSIDPNIESVYVAPSSSGLAIFIIVLVFSEGNQPTENDFSIHADVYGNNMSETTNGLPAELKVLSHGPIGATNYQISVGMVYTWTTPHHIANATAFELFIEQTFNGANSANISLKISRT